jgi:hypothetical protein
MTLATALLTAAIQLLALIAGTPNLDPTLTKHATEVANQAITQAYKVLDATSTTPTVRVPITNNVTPTQTTATVTTSVPQTFGSISMPQDNSAISVESTQTVNTSVDYPFGLYFLKVRVFDSNGKTTPIPSGVAPSQLVSMTIGDSVQNAFIDTRLGGGSDDYFHTFSYAPTSTYPVTITFVSGTLNKAITI